MGEKEAFVLARCNKITIGYFRAFWLGRFLAYQLDVNISSTK